MFTSSTGRLQESIDTITVAGAITTSTRLVATVKPNSTGKARVFFQNLIVTPTGELGKIDEGQVSNFRTVQNGILAIDMPNFYLAHTETTKPGTASQIHSSAMSAGEIYIPQGVLTLRFGGVDVDYTPVGGIPLNTTEQNNEFQINLGLPLVRGDQHHRQYGQQRRRSQFHRGLASIPGLRNLPGHWPAQSVPGQRDRRKHHRRDWCLPQLINSPTARGVVAGRHVRHLAGWCRHRADRQRSRRRQRDQLHHVRDRRSAQRGRVGRPARRQDQQLLHRRPDQERAPGRPVRLAKHRVRAGHG